MADLKSVVAEKLPLTMGETIALAKEYGVRVVDVEDLDSVPEL